jgi:hypothetical protein
VTRRAPRASGPPDVVLLVDRPSIVRLLDAALAVDGVSIATVCIDGTPRARVARLRALLRDEPAHRTAVLYLHDAATVVYPFAIEPVATLAATRDESAGDIVYVDLGLPPAGAPARRFADPTLPADKPILELERIPPGTLARYCAEAVRRCVTAMPGADLRRAP